MAFSRLSLIHIMSALEHMPIGPTDHRALHLCLHVEHDCLLLLPIFVFIWGILRRFCAPIQMAAVDVTSLCHINTVIQQELGGFLLCMIPEVVRLPLVVVDRLAMGIPQPQIRVRGKLLTPPVDWVGLD